MAFITSELNDDAIMMVECETTGAFSKSDLEIKPNPLMAFKNATALIGDVGKVVAESVQAKFKDTDANMQVRFGVKIDSMGSVLVSQQGDACQFSVTITFGSAGG